MNETWRGVPLWEALYEVSDIGRVRSLDRLGVRGRQAGRMYRGRMLKPILKKQLGYLSVTLHEPNGRKLQVGIHRLVLEAFVGPCPDGHQGCHNNADRADNRLANLRWDSVAANQADKVKHGNSLRGEKNLRAKLTEDDVRLILSSPLKQQQLADKYGVSQVLISRIRLRKAWKHIDQR